MTRILHILVLLSIGTTAINCLNVTNVLAPVDLKRTADKVVAVLNRNTTRIVIKFDKPITAEIENTGEFTATFQLPSLKKSPILRLDTVENKPIIKPTVIRITDKDSGEKISVMVMMDNQPNTTNPIA